MEGVVTGQESDFPRLNLRDMRVLVTGHTGFKGAWLSEWLVQMGARVWGIALAPESPDALFNILRLESRMAHSIVDIRKPEELASAVRQSDPQIVFHLAAQALVRRSYREPLLTWQTNVQGTLNLLQAVHALSRPVTVVVVTTDKVYRNREWDFAYREDDELGGHDPYSASKAACEIAVASWRASFGSRDRVSVVTARAGNVLGAGDISEDRIVPDCFRAWDRGEIVEVRNPQSTRPWQHVLEPLSGYIALAACAGTGNSETLTCNFGPGVDGDRTVETLVRSFARLESSRRWKATTTVGAHEAGNLSLSIERARRRLGWRPRLSFEDTVVWTNEGYVAGKSKLRQVVERQIADFEARCSTPD